VLYSYGMPTENDYTLQDLAALADVTPRTIRYYVAQGLLPSPGRVGPGTTYGEGHLARLRLIRQLQREHLPLAEIRARLASIDDATVLAIVEASPAEPTPGSAADYIRSVLAGSSTAPSRAFMPPPPAMPAPEPSMEELELADFKSLRSDLLPSLRKATVDLAEATPMATAESPGPDRSQWDRIVLVPDVELHVRRPLTRHLNKRVDRLIAMARQLLEEDPS
jgi:DNA-binding transcriptional MerR regulator